MIAGRDGVPLPSCYYSPAPPHSNEARAAKVEGIVIAEGLVTLDGTITHLKILKSLGSRLDESVLGTLKTWKCKSVEVDGRPVPVIAPFTFTFKLK